jgi:putative NADPH-quinone reductase
MAKRITIVEGHPDPKRQHFGQALADAYAGGAQVGHEVKRISVAQLEFPLIRSGEEFQRGEVPPDIRAAQDAITWANHLVIFYPLWQGDMPALLKAFFEQTFRYGFAIGAPEKPSRVPKKLLAGKSARVVLTMGMPAFAYRWYFGAHSLKIVERNILGLSGIRPVSASIVGGVEGNPARREKWLSEMATLGREAR